MKRPIGTRWKYRDNSIWEVVSHNDDHSMNNCVKVSGGGDVNNLCFLLEEDEDCWTYLGNFNKTNNFNNLYDILTGT